MEKRIKLLLTLSAFALVCGAWWLGSGPVAKGKSPFVPGSLDEKAHKAKSGDEDAVRDLADEVFHRYGRLFTSGVTGDVKDRVVRAEMEYRKSGKGGVRETHVVNAVNFLAGKFDAPDYAKTDHRQVRVLRARMSWQAPAFFAPDPDGRKGLKKKIGQQMNPEVSPLEAVCLMLVMLDQKALNEEYQQTPKEFATKVRRKPSWLEPETRGPAFVANDPRNIEKTREIMRTVEKGAANMKLADAFNLSGDTLDKLGIKK